MKVGIIAAGFGERLQAAGIREPKPLVRIAGKPLIDYPLAAVAAAGLRQVACIVNEQSAGIEEHCRAAWPQLEFTFARRTTPSSMESLFTLGPLLRDGRFLLMTVDSIFAPKVLADFLDAADRHRAADGVLALASFVDDEKPLWARVGADGHIVDLGAAAAGSGLVTAGFYAFDPVIFDEIDAARAARLSALRQFLGHLLRRGYGMYGVKVGKTVDVDRAEDIRVAEAFVRGGFEG
jgi:NDP-sugar pyrophosphorylase family protein